MRFLTSFVGAVVEAWQEVRVHRGRVLLSLVGVTLAVCALSASVAVTDLAQQAVLEQAEASSGRPFTMTGNVSPNRTVVPGEVDEAWFETLDRFEIAYATRVAYDYAPVQLPGGAMDASIVYVDQPYATLHRTRMVEGSWFAPGDRERLAPAVVVNTFLWEQLGSPDLATHPVISSNRFEGADLVIVGVYATPSWDEQPGLMMLASSAIAALPAGTFEQLYPSYEMWVPEDSGEQLMSLVSSDMSSRLGEGYSVDVYRTDYGALMDDPTAALRMMALGIGAVILLLGALGLLNIALVTVRQRIREIGIRRSMGATSGRVFFSVMMESVVATAVAGALGVMLAVLLVKLPIVEEIITQGMVEDLPPFPMSAAVFGLVAATAVGALAGIIPAVVAVRVKPIDAIRI
ncbi:putative ABC transport system permease protein [Labedella gwakjiensis]|uniref:ABC transporter permease n=1 Tax=Labedella gwakjiensis TaxID=390269 RepID=A0A2P8GYL7_9MICO|nr:ABC transporter permease [Labedella gwakjiensis]PSL39042.1 putative ABC transport system permease protein [Labedella gwakjiensis]RUQ86507.1 ABC transporter permease [Labedella gwakjiensis]